MSSKLEKVENNTASLELTIAAEKFDEALNKSFKKNGKKYTVPGFRKGKATRGMIEKLYGEGVFYDDAIDFAFPDAYSEAVKELGLDPVASPEIEEFVSIGKGKDLVLKLQVVVKPEVTLGEYKGIEVEKVEYTVTDEDVDKKLDEMVKENARTLEVTDRPVENGNTVIIDFEGFVDGQPFEGGSATDYKLEIGSGAFIPGFEEQLIGAEIGKEAEVNVTFPENYGSEELAAKPAVFKVTVKEISAKEYPAADDEFAKDVSEFETIAELKADIKKKEEEKAAEKAKNEYEDKAVKVAVENATVDIPQVMIDHEIDAMLRDFDYQLRYQGLNLETYMKYMNVTSENLKDQYKEAAQTRVKTQLVLEKIAKTEAFEVTDEDVEAEILKYAEAYNQKAEEFKKGLKDENIAYMKDGISVRKAVDCIVQKSVTK